MASRPRSSKGFSLVEMMISIVLGLIIVAGLISVLMANRAAYTIQQGSNFNQESMRFAATRLAWSLRMADFWGGVKDTELTTTTNTTGITGPGSCDAAWVLNVGVGAPGKGITGYDGGATFPIANCVDDANYVKYSDVVVVRYADTHGYDPAKASSTTPFDSPTAGDVPNQTSIFVVSAVNQSATIFRLGDAVPSNPLGSASGRYVYPYQIEMYYLQPCSDPGADGKCGTADDGDADARSPTLMRMRMDGTGALITEAVVDGIEQLQFEYSSPIPTTIPGATPFVPASAANFATVTQVRVSLVARSTTRDTAVPHTGTFAISGHCAYEIDAAGNVTHATPTVAANICTNAVSSDYGDKPQQYARTINTQVVVLRNRVRG
jgi:prepilin-type N-terminal cleavage/methylation domain-containing protein